MKSRLLLFSLVLLCLISCSGRKVFEQRHTFEQLKWNRFESVFFETDIKDTETNYDISVEIRHHTAYPFANLMMTLAIYSPSGERRIKDIDVLLRNADGTFKAQGNGDLWDITAPVLQGITFSEPGHYKFELENRMSKFDTPGMMEIGLLVEKSEK
ncbi:MAG: gliding motility lipoprotein GldH [Bacteroidetes bacterium]|nr:gliding motility lipoprotein GldH [Bacteroidota bacterium]